MKTSFADKLRRILAVAVGIPMAAPTGTCRACRRVLTSPKSIAAGIGACCAKRHARDERTLDMFEAGTPGVET
jgi:Family of unknown function (DUF6011)